MAVGNHKVEIVVGVRDMASRALGNISNSVSNMSRNIGSNAGVFGALNRTLDTTISKLDRAANSMYKFNMYTSSLQRNLRNMAAIGGIATGAVAYQGLNSALQFDYKTATMQARMETTSQVKKEIQDYILKDLNLRVGYSPTEIADTAITLGQAGINNTKDMKAMLNTTTYFAEAVGTDSNTAAESIVKAAKGFNISLQNATQIADKYTVALNASLLTIDELPHAMGQLAGTAKMYGQTMDSSLAILMAMKDQGLPAAQGAQNLLHSFSQLSRIGNDAVLFDRTRGYFEKLGITDAVFDKDTLKLKEMPELIADFEQAMIKQGFTNTKYNIKSHDDFKNFIDENGGIPEDFWDSMQGMPLISRIVGKAGMRPIMMGMQTKYEEVDPTTGEKTGQVYYGSEALKRMRDKVENSDGAVEKQHGIIEETGLFQLQVLKGAWEATQIQFLDNMVPVIKTGAEMLTNLLSGTDLESPEEKRQREKLGEPEPTRLGKFRYAISEAAANYREEGNEIGAQIIESIGNGVIDGIQIGMANIPMFKQIGEAFKENFVNADWGSNIIEFPMQIVRNGINFINDLLKSNEMFQEAVSQLPDNLQDPAKLVETLAKGGLILLVTGAIVKTIELGIRGVSAALKGTKMITDLTQSLFGYLTGGEQGGGPLKGKGVMGINANIVNVYGKAINSGGAPGTGGNGNGNTRSNRNNGNGGALLGNLKNAGIIGLGLGTGYVLTHPEEVKNMVQNNPVQKWVEKAGPNIESKVNTMHEVMKDPSKFSGPKDTEIVAAVEGNIWAKIKDSFIPKKVENEPRIKLPEVEIPALKSLDTKINQMLNEFAPQKPKAFNVEEYMNGVKESNIQNTREIQSSITTGFNSANEKLQNIQLQNHTNVQVTPNISISGNIPSNFFSVKTSNTSYSNSTSGKAGTGQDRIDQIMQRRLGWR